MICTTAAPLKTKILTFNLFLIQILRKVLCVNLTIYCWWLTIMCCLDEIGRFSYFLLSTAINCPRSRLKHPPTSADFQSKQITCSFIYFPIMERHCLSIISFVPLRILDIWVKALIDFARLCEVFVLVFLWSYTAYEHVEAQSMSPLISLNWF